MRGANHQTTGHLAVAWVCLQQNRPDMTDSVPRDPHLDARSDIIAELRRGRPLGEVAKEYGVLIADLCRWIAESVTIFESATLNREGDVNEEIRRLRLENECLRKQRDFYRKAAGIVSNNALRKGSTAEMPWNGNLI